MRNLMNFIWGYHNLWLFLILQFIALGMLVSFNRYQNVQFLSATSELSGSTYAAINNFQDYFSLKETNETLNAENAQLRNWIKSSYAKNEANPLIVVDSVYQRQYNYTQVKVLNSSVSREANMVLLDKGSKHGLYQDMGVIGPDGIIGKVVNVSENFSTVMPVVHKDFVTSARLKNSGYYGALTWGSKDPNIATLSDIQSHVDLSKGDTVETRFAGGVFPEGILVGTVDSWDPDESTGFITVQVRLSTDFRKLSFGYAVEHVQKLELDSLVQDFNTL